MGEMVVVFGFGPFGFCVVFFIIMAVEQGDLIDSGSQMEQNGTSTKHNVGESVRLQGFCLFIILYTSKVWYFLFIFSILELHVRMSISLL